MSSLKNEYRTYYENGSAARKRNTYENTDEYSGKRRYGKNPVRKNTVNSRKIKNSKKKTAIMVAGILCAFSMTMIMSYRYNLINEKNLKTISLKSDLDAAQADLLNAQIAVEQNTNLTEVEAYAKQKLGMQKPDKNQTIYVDTSGTSTTNIATSDSSNSTSLLGSLIEKISNLF